MPTLTPLPFGTFNFKVIVNDASCNSEKLVQFRFPKSKKKRIRNKWAKRPENFKLVKYERALIIPAGTFTNERNLIVGSTTFARLQDLPTLENIKSICQP